MSEKDESAKTMRIDIHPDFPGESPARKKSGSAVPDASSTTSFVARKPGDYDGTSDYEKLLQSIYDGVLITDFKGRIVDFNSRGVEFFLCDEDELSGTEIIDLISGADDTLLTAIRKNLEDHRYTLIEAHCVRRDKSMFPAEIAVNRVDLGDRQQLCFLIRDISIRKRTQAALEDAVARLEAHDRARSQFVSNVSHELRTPLTSMIYAVNNMLSGVVGTVPDAVRKYLKILEGDCKRLLATVNDILDLRKIESNTLTLATTRVPISRLVRSSVQSLAVQAEQKCLTMNISTDSRRRFVDCDPQKMERVILNVASNAVKFTPDGGEVDVAVKGDPGRDGRVLISIRDTGIGIPRDAVGKVMDRYFTIGDESSGSGLGLAISKEIVEMHGGTIEIKSPPRGYDTGTAVHVSLPVVRAPTVLIADDDNAVRDLLKKQVTEEGYKVITAGNGVEALERINKDRPDLVILDLVMPDLDGSGVILRMKSSEEMMRIPVIVVTGAHVGKARAQILNNFSIPALSKPWRESVLLDRVAGAFLGAATLVSKAP